MSTLTKKRNITNEIKYFSMFTGVGGFELGLDRANYPQETQGEPNKDLWKDMPTTKGRYGDSRRTHSFSCVGMSEIDKYSGQVLRHKFPNTKNWGDCTKIDPKELPDFDMLCGGFPCQAFSIAGKRRGFEDTRGTMFFEIARVLKVKRPKIVLLENVKGLLNHAKGETFRVILRTLDELGYEAQWMVLNSKFFGVPQNRERVLIVGNLGGERRPEILPFRESNKITNESNARGISPALNTAQGGNRHPKIRAVLTPKRPTKRQNRRRFKEEGEPSFTVTAQDIHGVMLRDGRDNRSCLRSGRTPEVGYAGYSVRRLTPTECCRLQGFPDDWNEWGINEKGEVVRMSDTQRYKQMGNAVTTNVIVAIGKQLGL